MRVTGKLLGYAGMVDGAGKPQRDEVTLGVGRCLLIVECCAVFLKQLEAPGVSELEVERLTNLLGLNVIQAAEFDGARLSEDNRVLGAMVGIELQPFHVKVNRGRMDS